MKSFTTILAAVAAWGILTQALTIPTKNTIQSDAHAFGKESGDPVTQPDVPDPSSTAENDGLFPCPGPLEVVKHRLLSSYLCGQKAGGERSDTEALDVVAKLAEPPPLTTMKEGWAGPVLLHPWATETTLVTQTSAQPPSASQTSTMEESG